MSDPKPRAKRSPQLADKICALIQQGFSLRYSCIDLGISTWFVLSWLRHDESFATQYARAREDQAELLADEIKELSDTATAENHAAVRIKVDSRKWIASKLKPKVYGDRPAEVNFTQNNIVVMSLEEQAKLQERRRKLLEG